MDSPILLASISLYFSEDRRQTRLCDGPSLVLRPDNAQKPNDHRSYALNCAVGTAWAQNTRVNGVSAGGGKRDDAAAVMVGGRGRMRDLGSTELVRTGANKGREIRTWKDRCRRFGYRRPYD